MTGLDAESGVTSTPYHGGTYASLHVMAGLDPAILFVPAARENIDDPHRPQQADGRIDPRVEPGDGRDVRL